MAGRGAGAGYASLALEARALWPKGSDNPGIAPLGADAYARAGAAHAVDLAVIAAMPRVTLLRPRGGDDGKA